MQQKLRALVASPLLQVCKELQGSAVFPGTKVCMAFNKEAVKESLVGVFILSWRQQCETAKGKYFYC